LTHPHPNPFFSYFRWSVSYETERELWVR
jgi:hypothetical protein